MQFNRTRHLIVLPSKAYFFSCKVISCLFNYFKDVILFITGEREVGLYLLETNRQLGRKGMKLVNAVLCQKKMVVW